MRRETSTFLALNISNSARRTAGSTTTPLPVTGVVATLVSHGHVHVTRHEVGQLPFTFITPLGSDDHRCGHWAPPSRPRCKQSLLHKNCCFVPRSDRGRDVRSISVSY